MCILSHVIDEEREVEGYTLLVKQAIIDNTTALVPVLGIQNKTLFVLATCIIGGVSYTGWFHTLKKTKLSPGE